MSSVGVFFFFLSLFLRINCVINLNKKTILTQKTLTIITHVLLIFIACDTII